MSLCFRKTKRTGEKENSSVMILVSRLYLQRRTIYGIDDSSGSILKDTIWSDAEIQ